MKEIIVYTDGSVYPNPGGMGGWAYVAPDYDSQGDYSYSGWQPRTTNNRMELMAAINCLSIVSRGDFITIVTDSQYVQRCFARRQWPESKPNADLGHLLAESKRGRFVEVKLVAGHSGDKYNEQAHELANKARLDGLAWTKRREEEAASERVKPRIRGRFEELIAATMPGSQYENTLQSRYIRTITSVPLEF